MMTVIVVISFEVAVVVIVISMVVVAVTVAVVITLTVAVVLALVGVVRALAWAGAVVDTFIEVLTAGMRVDFLLIIVSNVAVELLITDVIHRVMANIDIDVLTDVNVHVFAVAITAFVFAMSGPLEGFSC